MNEYESYSSPLHSAAYSPQFFSNLTFCGAANLDYPCIALAGSLLLYRFVDNVPSDSASTMILHGETIPHLDNVVAISREMAEAFLSGKRAVVTHFSFDSSNVRRKYHFSKVSLLPASTYDRLTKSLA